MPRRVSLVCDEHLLERVDALAREHGLSRQEALRQAVEVGLDAVENGRPPGTR